MLATFDRCMTGAKLAFFYHLNVDLYMCGFRGEAHRAAPPLPTHTFCWHFFKHFIKKNVEKKTYNGAQMPFYGNPFPKLGVAPPHPLFSTTTSIQSCVTYKAAFFYFCKLYWQQVITRCKYIVKSSYVFCDKLLMYNWKNV